jgi:hypothetical protein
MLLALVALGAVAAPSPAVASPMNRWQKTYQTNCVTVAAPGDPFSQGCQIQTTESLEFRIGQLVGGAAVSGASALTITVAPSHAQCATVQVQTSGSYKRPGISNHLEDPVDFDLSQGRALTLDQSDWFTGAWDLHVLLTVNTPSMGCPSAPAVSDGDSFTVTLNSPPNLGQIGGVETASRAGHGIDVFFGWSGAGRITISATARTAGVRPFVFARKSFVARQPSDGSRFHLSLDARARSLLAKGKLLRIVVTVTEHPQRGRVNSQIGYGSLIP